MSTPQNTFTLSAPSDAQLTFSITQAALNAKAQAIAAADSCTAIASAEDLNTATAALAELTSIKKAVTAAHAEVKEPFLTFTRALDAAKKNYIAELDTAADRLSKLIGEHQLAERAKADAARRAAQSERNQILSQAAERQRERIAEETAVYNRTGAGTGTLSADLQHIQDEAAADAAATVAAATAHCNLAASGTTVRKTWKFRLVDAHALAQSHPELVIIGVNRAAVNAILKATDGAPIPGLEIWSEVSASVKASPKTATQLTAEYDY